MNLRTVAAFLVGTSFFGCVVNTHRHDHDAPLYPGDVSFRWSFAGLTCAEVPEVQSVRVSIPGEYLQNDGVFPCQVGGYPGMDLYGFSGGYYSYSVEAFGYDGSLLYTGAGNFTVDGDVRVAVDLTPAGAPTSYAYLSWRLPPTQTHLRPTCAQAGVTTVEVSIDGVVTAYPCNAGQLEPGVQTPFVRPGAHAVELVALTSGGYPMFRAEGTLQTFAGEPIASSYLMGWAVGGTAVRWQLSDGSIGLSCAQAGVQYVRVNFVDNQGQWLYGAEGDLQPCDTSHVLYQYLPPGTHRVVIEAEGAMGAVFSSNTQVPPSVNVYPGVFATEQDAVTVQVYRVQ